MRKTWPDYEVQWIIDNCHLSTDEMHEHFPGRTRDAVKNKRQEILSKLSPAAFMVSETAQIVERHFPESIMSILDPYNDLGLYGG